MDRQIIYPGQIPLDTDVLNTNKYAMTAIAKLVSAVLGNSPIVNGLAVTQSVVPNMQVAVSVGEIYTLANMDSTSYGSIAADTTHQVMKQGILLDGVSLSCPAPGTVGFSINYLIQAAFAETDTGSVVLPYYNASNPSAAWSGPANSGTPQATTRQDQCVVTAKAGAAATTGTQATPAPDSGNVGLAVVTVAYGAATIVNANIAQYVGASLVPQNGLASNVSHAMYTKNVAGASDVTLTAQEAAFPILTLTGALTGNINLIVPAASRQRVVSNQTTGAFQITVKTAAGTGTIVPQGLNLPVYCDGTNVLSQVSALMTLAQGDARYASISIFPRAYLAGCVMSTPGSSATMNIAGGTASDVSNGVLMSLVAMSKTTAAWAAGTGNGGKISAAAIAPSTWYYWIMIRRPDTGQVDVGFTDSPSSFSLPTNYTQYRYIGASLTDASSNWTAFTQFGREFYWGTPKADFSGAGAATAALLTCSIPRGRKMKGIFSIYTLDNVSTLGATYLSDPDNADVVPGTSNYSFMSNASAGSGSGQATCFTNTAAQIRHREANTSTIGIATLGWIDLADSQI